MAPFGCWCVALLPEKNVAAAMDIDIAATMDMSSKRRRTSPSAVEPVLSLTDLPNDQLVAIADFLPKTSRALFAVALTASPELFRDKNWSVEINDASKAVIESTKPPVWKPTPAEDCPFAIEMIKDIMHYAAEPAWSMLSLSTLRISW